MEGVGARLGRSSTRYGPATVFTGPVRKWKKKWVHVSPSNAAASNSSSSAVNSGHNLNGSTASAAAAAAAASGGNASHLILYKWTPITQSGNTNGGGGNTNGNNIGSNGVDKSSMNSDATAAEEPPRRRFKYTPIALLEEEKDEDVEINAAEDVDDEGKPSENDLYTVEMNNRSGVSDEKPDINNMPMEVSEDDNKGVRQDLNESTLDLSLSFKAGDGNHDD